MTWLKCRGYESLGFWANKAALLDPRCYNYRIGASWSIAVPPGETWFALNLWWVNPIPGAWMFHRPLDVNRALALPAGTVLVPETQYPGSYGFAYYARPKVVFDIDARYRKDPQSLYWERCAILDTLPLRFATVIVPLGTPVNGSECTVGALFDWGDTTTQYGIVRHVSIIGLSWAAMVGGYSEDPNHTDMMNTLNEVSDHQQQRLAEPITCPFKRYNASQPNGGGWTGIQGRAGTITGAQSGSQDHAAGHAVVAWSKLPEGW